jgi:hypothetical protein
VTSDLNSTGDHGCHSSVLLIVRSDKGDPSAVTEALGLPPRQTWTAGTLRDGSENEHHAFSGWKAEVPPHLRSACLIEQCDFWLGFISPSVAKLQALARQGWDLELNCFAASSDELLLDASDLGELSAAGVRLTVTFLSDG